MKISKRIAIFIAAVIAGFNATADTKVKDVNPNAVDEIMTAGQSLQAMVRNSRSTRFRRPQVTYRNDQLAVSQTTQVTCDDERFTVESLGSFIFLLDKDGKLVLMADVAYRKEADQTFADYWNAFWGVDGKPREVTDDAINYGSDQDLKGVYNDADPETGAEIGNGVLQEGGKDLFLGRVLRNVFAVAFDLAPFFGTSLIGHGISVGDRTAAWSIGKAAYEFDYVMENENEQTLRLRAAFSPERRDQMKKLAGNYKSAPEFTGLVGALLQDFPGEATPIKAGSGGEKAFQGKDAVTHDKEREKVAARALIARYAEANHNGEMAQKAFVAGLCAFYQKKHLNLSQKTRSAMKRAALNIELAVRELVDTKRDSVKEKLDYAASDLENGIRLLREGKSAEAEDKFKDAWRNTGMAAQHLALASLKLKYARRDFEEFNEDDNYAANRLKRSYAVVQTDWALRDGWTQAMRADILPYVKNSKGLRIQRGNDLMAMYWGVNNADELIDSRDEVVLAYRETHQLFVNGGQVVIDALQAIREGSEIKIASIVKPELQQLYCDRNTKVKLDIDGSRIVVDSAPELCPLNGANPVAETTSSVR